MSHEEANKLHYFQVLFEDNPTCENALHLFEQLNKYKMFMSVVRLFYKYEMDSERRQKQKDFESMRAEFEYARDRLLMFANTDPNFELEGYEPN